MKLKLKTLTLIMALIQTTAAAPSVLQQLFGELDLETEEQLLRRHTPPIMTTPSMTVAIVDSLPILTQVSVHALVFSEKGSITIVWVAANLRDSTKTCLIRETVYTTPDSTESVEVILNKWKRLYSGGLLRPQKWGHKYEEVVRQDGEIKIKTNHAEESSTIALALVEDYPLGRTLRAKTREIYHHLNNAPKEASIPESEAKKPGALKRERLIYSLEVLRTLATDYADEHHIEEAPYPLYTKWAKLVSDDFGDERILECSYVPKNGSPYSRTVRYYWYKKEPAGWTQRKKELPADHPLRTEIGPPRESAPGRLSEATW